MTQAVSLTIVRANAADAEPILAMKLRAFEDEFRRYGAASIPPEFDSLIQQMRVIEELHYYKILRDGELVGAMCVVDLGEGELVLASLYVEPRVQGQGIGTEAIIWVERQFPHARRWRLDTPYLSFSNQRLYERLGFRKLGERVPKWAEGSDFRLYEYEKRMDRRQSAV
jgi:ribosomal protein S18 acetylase RimI-like enzyme